MVVAPRGRAPHEVVIDVDDLAVEVRGDRDGFVLGAGALALMYLLEARSPRTPGPLIIMAAGIFAVSVL